MSKSLKSKVTRLTVSLPQELVEELERIASLQRYSVSLSEVIRTACAEHVKALRV